MGGICTRFGPSGVTGNDGPPMDFGFGVQHGIGNTGEMRGMDRTTYTTVLLVKGAVGV